METLEARFVGAIIDRLAAVENLVQRQSDEIDALKRQTVAPVLAATNITSEQMTFGDGTAIHWALGRPAGIYVQNALQPLAPPYSEVVVARGPLQMFVCSTVGTGFDVCVSAEVGQITLGRLITKVNEHLTTTAAHWSELELFLGKSAWQLKQGYFGLQLEVETEFPILPPDDGLEQVDM